MGNLVDYARNTMLPSLQGTSAVQNLGVDVFWERRSSKVRAVSTVSEGGCSGEEVLVDCR